VVARASAAVAVYAAGVDRSSHLHLVGGWATAKKFRSSTPRPGLGEVLGDDEGGQASQARGQADDVPRYASCRYRPPARNLAPGSIMNSLSRSSKHVRFNANEVWKDRAAPLLLLHSASDS